MFKQSLSPRQLEALNYTARGFTARQTAEKMNCREQTVKNFLYYARMKYQANNNVHLVYLVFCSPDITSA